MTSASADWPDDPISAGPRVLFRADAFVGRQEPDGDRTWTGVAEENSCRYRYRMNPAALADAVSADRAAGVLPIAVVATVGTTSTTSIDPVPAIAEVCEREGLGCMSTPRTAASPRCCPSHAHILAGAERADSLVVNPAQVAVHARRPERPVYCRRMDVARAAFALTPEYILTGDEAEAARRNLMNTGIQLGRRFRSLKLWMILRSFGAKAIRAHLAEHIRLAQLFASWVDAHPDFERLAPVPLSVVCFQMESDRATGEAALGSRDRCRQRTAARSRQQRGEVFLSHTQLREGVALRLAVGHRRTRPSATSSARGTCSWIDAATLR